MRITIHLPVSKPIKNFLTHKFGEEYKPNQSEWFGILLCSLFDKKSSSNWEDRVKGVEYEELYLIHLNLSYAEKHGISISPFHKRLLQKAVESVFRDSLYEVAILNKECYDIDYKTTFENLLDFYGITEEDKSYYQTLIRDFNRKKDRIKHRMTKNKNS